VLTTPFDDGPSGVVAGISLAISWRGNLAGPAGFGPLAPGNSALAREGA